MDTQTLRSEVKNHLETKILPFLGKSARYRKRRILRIYGF